MARVKIVLPTGTAPSEIRLPFDYDLVPEAPDHETEHAQPRRPVQPQQPVAPQPAPPPDQTKPVFFQPPIRVQMAFADLLRHGVARDVGVNPVIVAEAEPREYARLHELNGVLHDAQVEHATIYVVPRKSP